MNGTATRGPRIDALPEGWILRGKREPCGHLSPCGCRYHHGCCGVCPLLECAKTGISHKGRQVAQAPRNAAIVNANRSGVAIGDICIRFQLGARRVYSILAQARRPPAPPSDERAQA